MKTKLQKMADKLNDEFRNLLDAEFEKRYGLKLITEFNIFSMKMISYREDEEELTLEQMNFVAGYSEGYAAAMNQVRDE